LLAADSADRLDGGKEKGWRTSIADDSVGIETTNPGPGPVRDSQPGLLAPTPVFTVRVVPESLSTPTASTPLVGVREDCWGIVASTAMHVAAIAALSCVLLAPSPPRRAPMVQTRFDDATAEQPETPPVVLLPSVRSSQSGGRQVIAQPNVQPPTAEPTVRFDDRILTTTGPLVANLDLREAVRLSAAAPSNGTGNGRGNGTGDGNGRGLEYFPLDDQPGRYVFVVDGSQSMTHRYPGPARSRFGRVKVELWRTIYRMSADQKFFVIFFNTRAFPMPATELRPGGMENQSDLFQWTASLKADGQTDPLEAMLMAMRLQPDVIYFLTDGEFNYKVVREVAKANQRGVKIHTISLGDDSGAKFLEEIASRTGGSYRHIVQEEDQYWDEATAEAASEAAVAKP
jgi:hypothetical protein